MIPNFWDPIECTLNVAVNSQTLVSRDTGYIQSSSATVVVVVQQKRKDEMSNSVIE